MNRFFKNVVIFCHCEEALFIFFDRGNLAVELRDCFVTPLRFVPRNDGVEVSLRGRAFYLFRLEAASRRRGEWQSPFPSSVIAKERFMRLRQSPSSSKSLRGGMTFADEATSPLWFFHPLMGVVLKGGHPTPSKTEIASSLRYASFLAMTNEKLVTFLLMYVIARLRLCI